MKKLFKTKFDLPLRPESTNSIHMLPLKKLYNVDKYTIGTQITRQEIGFKSNNPDHLKDYRTSDHPSLVNIPIFMIKNCDQPSDIQSAFF